MNLNTKPAILCLFLISVALQLTVILRTDSVRYVMLEKEPLCPCQLPARPKDELPTNPKDERLYPQHSLSDSDRVKKRELTSSSNPAIDRIPYKIKRLEAMPSRKSTFIQSYSIQKASNNKQIPEPVVRSPSENDHLEPMVLSLDYREQTANAMGSLYDLQCWASSVGIGKVVEPSMRADKISVFHFLPDQEIPQRKVLSFHDLYDIEHWNEMSRKHVFSPLVSTGHFLEHAVRNIVFVQIVYRLHPLRCLPEYVYANQQWYHFLLLRGFRIVKSVCIDFRLVRGNVMTADNFRNLIFNKIEQNVTILFNSWEGIRADQDFRVALEGSKCSNCLLKMDNIETVAARPAEPVHISPGSTPAVVPSELISNLTSRVLSELVSGEKYLVVMLRAEKINKTILGSISKRNPCAKNIVADAERMSDENGIKKIFLFTDADPHGSLTLKSSSKFDFTEYVRKLMHLKDSSKKMNDDLEKIAGSRDTVLIALLTQQIAAHATCLVMAGGGRYQGQILNMFAHHHKHQEQELCYTIRNSYCETRYIGSVYSGD